MSGSDWRPVRSVDRRQLSEARVEAHYAVQWLARAARAFIAPRPGDSHTNLGWDEALGGLRTHRLPDGMRLGLIVADLTLLLLMPDPAAPPYALSLSGRTDADARAWLGRLVAAQGLDAAALDDPSPYEMPAHATANGAPYAGTELADALGTLATWFGNANYVLGRARQELIARKLDAPPVRCWPHHFDLDILVAFDRPAPDDSGSMGVGFSPGDEHYDEPYFYVTIYPHPDVAALPHLPEVGHWHSNHFTGAIAPAHRIVAALDQREAVEVFQRVAIEAAVKALS